MKEKKATRAAYGEYLVELGQKNKKIVVLDADLSEATNTNKFCRAFPDRFFNCGIAEANMIDMAAGLSTTGLIPFASTFAIFGAGRAYESIRNGVAYPGFNVKLAFTHAGISVGEDGGSHQAIEDIALMRVIPGMTVIVPSDANETRKAVDAAINIDGPVYIRLSRLATETLGEQPFTLGRANVLRDGSDAVLFCCGVMVENCLKAAELLGEAGVSAAVVNMHTIKPLDEEIIRAYAGKCKKVITVEEHSVIGGLGDAVASVLCGQGSFRFRKLGVQDRFGQSGRPQELFEEYGLSVGCIVNAVKEL
ncbi:MAG: transketolase family protein [Oscillospiraceae bacterium]|nr:transketolase family protein [Oscillospiraceae bacterium]